MNIDGLLNSICYDKNKDSILERYKNHNKLPNKKGNKPKVRFNVLRFPYLFNFLFFVKRVNANHIV